MSDEITKIVLGDTAISAVEEVSSTGKRWFGRRKAQRPAPTHCENCGAPLRGHWCAKCGQPAIDYRRSFRHVIVDVLNEFLNWDSKFFATIGLLVAKPWRLTNEFLGGHRVRYVHPLRLYLLASILFFFAVNYWARSIHFQKDHLTPSDRARIEAKLATKNLTPQQRAAIEQALDTPGVSPEAALIAGALNRETKGELNGSPSPVPSSTAVPSPAATTTPAEPMLGFDDEKSNHTAGKWLEKRAREKIGENGTNAQLLARALISNLPYMVLCCIPLFAFVLKILYIRRGIFYIDHLVYALHIHSFAYLGIMLIVGATLGLERIAPGLLAGWLIAVLWTAFAIQIFLSIRRVYRQGWFFTLFKFFLGGMVYLVVLSAALLVTLIITLVLP